MRAREIKRLKELESMAREILSSLDNKPYQAPPFVDVTMKEAKISANRLVAFLEEAVWLAENPLP